MIFFAIFFGTIAAIFFAIFVIYKKIEKSLGRENFNQIKDTFKNAKEIIKEDYASIKSVSGMTSLLLPVIQKDFPDLNENLLYAKVEDDIRNILNSLENRDFSLIKNNSNLALVKEKLEEEINDRKNQNLEECYDNIEFNAHGIKSYQKLNGKATIEISSSVGYMFSSNDKKKEQYTDIKKQTRFTTKYVYVYDESKLDAAQTMIFMHCPNCGAILKTVNGNVTCEYCGTYVEPVNLKEWRIVSFKNDYENIDR